MNASPHPDDDALSAHLDGLDAGAGTAEHLAACAECRTRVDALAAAASLIGAPLPPPASHLVDDAVARALDTGARGARRPVLVALAAAVLVVLGLVGVAVVGDEERPSESDTALTEAGGEATTDAAGGVAGGVSEVAFGGDLGDLSDPTALADRVRTVVEPPPPAADEAGESGAVMAPSAQHALTARGSNTTKASKDPYCEQAVADEFDKGLGLLVYRAVLTWKGAPAVAVVYELDDAKGELDHRLYVLASDGCELLVAQTF